MPLVIDCPSEMRLSKRLFDRLLTVSEDSARLNRLQLQYLIAKDDLNDALPDIPDLHDVELAPSDHE